MRFIMFDIILNLIIAAEIAILIAEVEILIKKLGHIHHGNCNCNADNIKKPAKSKKHILISPSYRALAKFRDNGY